MDRWIVGAGVRSQDVTELPGKGGQERESAKERGIIKMDIARNGERTVRATLKSCAEINNYSCIFCVLGI